MFAYRYYDMLIKTLQGKGYEFSSFESYNPLKTVYLRHDVDIDIFGVLPMAEIEYKNNVKSIWFFQPNNDIYNMLNSYCLDIISRIAHMGHQIGLHIDASIYSNEEELKYGIGLLYDFYKNFIPLTRIISFHRPAVYLLDDFQVDGFISTYEKRYFNDIVYVSDSNRREFWREDSLFDAIKAGRSIQLLTHPLWWKENLHDKQAILDYVRGMAKTLIADRGLKLNCKSYKDL